MYKGALATLPVVRVGCVIVFPCRVVGDSLLRVGSVSVILHQRSAAGFWSELKTGEEITIVSI